MAEHPSGSAPSRDGLSQDMTVQVHAVVYLLWPQTWQKDCAACSLHSNDGCHGMCFLPGLHCTVWCQSSKRRWVLFVLRLAVSDPLS